MTEEQFEFDLGRYGGDLARWPADRRADAAALIAQSPEAARRHRAAVALDRLLTPSPLPRTNDAALQGMTVRITALAQEPASAPIVPSQRRVPWLRTAACVAAALAGFGVGALQSHRERVPYDVLDLAFGSPAGDFDAQ
jgi:hypothetical protein